MPKKLTYETVKSEFEKRGYILLENEYINSHTKMRYICDKGHINYIVYSSFKNGNGCLECSGKQKLTYDFVKSEFKKVNYKLLETEYKSVKTKMKYICDKGHVNYIHYNNFKTGKRCPNCAIIKNSDRQRLDYDFIKQEFEKRNYILLEKEYLNNKTRMKYICDKGHESCISYDGLRIGQGCKQCYLSNSSGKNNPNWNPNREQIKITKQIKVKSYKMLRTCLKLFNKPKSDRTYKLLGYYPNQLQEHLQSFPNWNELKEQDWHLDHIIPIKAFVDYNIDDLKIINNLKNLQPFNKDINLKKGSKYRKKDFHKYMKQFTEWEYDKNTFRYIKIG